MYNNMTYNVEIFQGIGSSQQRAGVLVVTGEIDVGLSYRLVRFTFYSVAWCWYLGVGIGTSYHEIPLQQRCAMFSPSEVQIAPGLSLTTVLLCFVLLGQESIEHKRARSGGVRKKHTTETYTFKLIHTQPKTHTTTPHHTT